MDLVKIERRGAVAVLALDRPPVNALSGELIGALHAAVERLDNARVVVLTGSQRAFSVGADVGELASTPALRDLVGRGHALCDSIERFDRPVIAAIEGHCLGGGLEVAMACHLRVAGEGAQLGLPEVKLGILPGFGGTQRLPRLVGRAAALEMMLTGEPVGAARARELGLVNRVVETGAALEAAVDLASTLATRSRSAVAAILRVGSFAEEIDAVVEAIGSPDGREGIAAFREKRAPRFAS